MTRKYTKRAKQTTIAGTDTALSKAVDDFIDNKVEITELKLAQDQLGDKILLEMQKEGREMLKVEHGGEAWLFEILPGEKKLRCAKATKTPEGQKEMDLVDA